MTSDPLADLPPPARRRIAVRLTPDATRQVRGGHPWVFASSVTSASHEGAAGDMAVVFDSNRRFIAIGLWDPTSPIRLKVLHRGKPTPLDQAWWAGRIEAVLDRRRSLDESRTTTGYRCIHGENDGFPGLVLDRYESTFVLKLYSGAWIPHLPMLVPLLRDRLRAEAVVLRLSRQLQRDETFGLSDGLALVGSTPTAPVSFLENGLRFEAAVVKGHKTGHFLDQRDNRARVRSMAAGTRVLDVFSYTGGFSLYAAAGGAVSVHSVDQSSPALEAAARTFAHNRDNEQVRGCRHTTAAGDAFAVMRALADRGERYDIVVVDPPSFAQKEADVPQARRAYGHLTELSLALLRPGGLLVQASCSSRISAEDYYATVTRAAHTADVQLEEVARTSHGVDHPIGFPEGGYLKAIFARTARRPQ